MIETIKRNQYQILVENFPDLQYIQSIILNTKRNLWESKINSDDFLNVRLGFGTIPLKVKLNYSEEKFTLLEDILKDKLKELIAESKYIQSCPITINLTDRNKLALDNNYYRHEMLKNILLQLATFYSYNDLKFVFMINNDTDTIWQNVKILPHVWSDNKDIRLFANNYEEMTKISFYLEQVYMNRKYSDNDGKIIYFL